MKIRLSQIFYVLSQPKLSIHFKILFSVMLFKEAIIILSFMYCFWENTPTYLKNPLLFFAYDYVNNLVVYFSESRPYACNLVINES